MAAMGDLKKVMQEENMDSVGKEDINPTLGNSEQLGEAGSSWSGSLFDIPAQGRVSQGVEVFEGSCFGSMFDHPTTAVQQEAAFAGPESIFTGPVFSSFEETGLDPKATTFDLSEANASQSQLQWTKAYAFTEEGLAAELKSAIRDEQQPTHQNPFRHGVSHPAPISRRSFICGVNGCRKAYKRSYELRRHRKVHSSTRPHGCTFPFCNKSGQNGFVRKDHLRQHLRQVHHV